MPLVKSIFFEFSNVLKEIKKYKILYLYFFFHLVNFSGLVKQFSTDSFLAVYLMFSGAVVLFSKKLRKKDLQLIFFIVMIFSIINILPTLLFGINIKIFLGYTARIVIGIFILIYYRNDFFIVFEKIVFFLAFVSLPLFMVQVIYSPFFDIFIPISEIFLTDDRLGYGIFDISGHRYLFIYLLNSFGSTFRNSGFMWEPAAYGALLAWAILINVFINRFRINPRLIILFIAALTTFSIGTYFYLSIFIFIYLTKNFGNRHGMLFLFLILIILPGALQLNFVQENIQMITDKILREQSMTERIIADVYSQHRVSRVGGFFGNIGILAEQPFGFGTQSVSTEYYLYETPNGLMALIRNWGIFSIIILILCSYKIVRKLSAIFGYGLNMFHIILLMLIILLPIAGNPFYNQPFLFAVLLSGFIVADKKMQMKQHL